MTGLMVNANKSEFIPVDEVANAEALVGLLGCTVKAPPMLYLGVP